MSFVPIIFGKKDWDAKSPFEEQYHGIYCPNCHNFQDFKTEDQLRKVMNEQLRVKQ
ncbi:hypothetical protein C6P41_000210 [Kluyveromyces marxianus]|nr:hypothetical protein C6P41_000210 [Kluyveromyces marxianus]